MEGACDVSRSTPRPASDEAKTRRLIPLVRQQVLRGGLTLARLLDEGLA